MTAGALLPASAFRSTTGVLMEPIEHSTGWSRDVTSGAASLNLVLYGIAAPFTAALMQAWGVRRTVTWSLVIVGLASAAVTLVGEPWQLWLLWGVFIGLGTGSMALTFGTIIANRWFVTHRGTVTGVFSAATAAGQVLFVPVIAMIAAGPGWRTASLVAGGVPSSWRCSARCSCATGPPTSGSAPSVPRVRRMSRTRAPLPRRWP